MTVFEPTDEERQVSSTAREFLADFVDNTYLNEQEQSPDGFEEARWNKLCDLGWTGVHLPDRVGGADGTLVDAALIARECGRAGFATPLLQSLRVGTVLTTLDAGTRFDDELTGLAEGRRVALVAPPDRTVTARATDGGYVLSGPTVLVEWLSQSDTAVVLVPEEAGARWLCAAVRRSDLVERIADVPSIDNERIARLDLDGFVLSRDQVRADGVASRSAEYALARANLLRASAMVGGCEDVVERTAGYALERHQFGRPIGGFQAVRHHLARMVIAADGARLLCDDALVRARPDADEAAIAAAALFAAGRSYVEIVLTAAQVHGGVGTTVEHILHHHFRRAKAMQLRSGKRANRLRELHEALVVRHEGSLW